MAANVLVDAQGVFGTGLFVPVVNANIRYLNLKSYQAAPDQYDGVLFASSRGYAFDTRLLARRLGVRAVATFSVPDGLMTDHLPALEYLLRDKAARGTHMAAIFLLLDADLFGTRPWTDNNIDSFLPPEVGGESRWRFWWRYLTVFQYADWRRYIFRALASRLADAQPLPVSAPKIARVRRIAASPPHPAAPLAGAVDAAAQQAAGVRIRPDLAHQLELLKRFVALCRRNNIRLVAAFSPLNPRNEYAGEVQKADNEGIVAAVSRIMPVSDFGGLAWLAQRPDLWNDVFHFKSAVADIMLRRIFGAETIAHGRPNASVRHRNRPSRQARSSSASRGRARAHRGRWRRNAARGRAYLRARDAWPSARSRVRGRLR
jgi:hypothetical protein